MTTNWAHDQKRMMYAYGQLDKTHITGPSMSWTHQSKPDLKLAGTYLKMMIEEVGETMIACNPVKAGVIKQHIVALEELAVVTLDYDPVEALDGAVDTHVVTMGFQICMRYDPQQAWDAVLGTNLEKVDPATKMVKRRPDGKVLKPDGWEPPTKQLAAIARNAGHIFKG